MKTIIPSFSITTPDQDISIEDILFIYNHAKIETTVFEKLLLSVLSSNYFPFNSLRKLAYIESDKKISILQPNNLVKTLTKTKNKALLYNLFSVYTAHDEFVKNPNIKVTLKIAKTLPTSENTNLHLQVIHDIRDHPFLKIAHNPSRYPKDSIFILYTFITKSLYYIDYFLDDDKESGALGIYQPYDTANPITSILSNLSMSLYHLSQNTYEPNGIVKYLFPYFESYDKILEHKKEMNSLFESLKRQPLDGYPDINDTQKEFMKTLFNEDNMVEAKLLFI